MNCDINDVRVEKDFKGISFSGYKLTEVKSSLLKSLDGCKIEEACYWSAEIVCAGHYKELFDLIIYYYSKYIHIANPKLANYLDVRIKSIIDIIRSYGTFELSARNSGKTRKLICEIMTLLCNTKKKYIMNDIKIESSSLELVSIRDKMKAPKVSYLADVFSNEEDPKEIFIPINELCYQLSIDGGDTATACYWIEWVMEWDKKCRKNNIKVSIARRVFSDLPIHSKEQKDIIWMLWECILKEVSTRKNILLTRVINSMLYLFSVRYSPAVYIKRRYLLYASITLLHMPITVLNEPLLTEDTKELVEIVTKNIDSVYKQIKTNEHSPNTDYLFNGLDKRSNLEKSLKKLEMLNSVMGNNNNDIEKEPDLDETNNSNEV
jgi:hypothetical protein